MMAAGKQAGVLHFQIRPLRVLPIVVLCGLVLLYAIIAKYGDMWGDIHPIAPPPIHNSWIRGQMIPSVATRDIPIRKLERDPVLQQNEPLPIMNTIDTRSARKFNQSYDCNWVRAGGKFVDRVKVYNQALADVTVQMVRQRNNAPWRSVSKHLQILWCNRDDCLQELERHPEVQTVALRWSDEWHPSMQWDSRNDSANVILNVFHPWSVSEPLCSYIQTPGRTKARWDAVYNRTCTADVHSTSAVTSLEPVYLHGKPINVRDYWPNDGSSYPHYFYTTPPPHVFHVHILQDGVITGLGDIITGDLKLLLYSCSQDQDPRPPTGHEATPLYEEVFVITQFWGQAYFHKMLEGYPRIAPYLNFLNTNKHIKIHVAEPGGLTAEVLGLFGIHSSRLITEVCRANIVYLPQSTPCGFAHAQAIQLLTHNYHMIIREHFNIPQRRSIVLIQRSGERRLIQHQQVSRALQELSVEFGLQFELFADNPSPGMNETMQIFYRAALVVGPHGAGLANIVYSRPGTYVIEALCHPPHVNMCFQWTAHVLGHHYHGIMARRGCLSVIDVDADDVIRVARQYAEMATNAGVTDLTRHE